MRIIQGRSFRNEQARSLQNTLERVRPSVQRLRRDSSRGCFATGCTGDASGVDTVNSRVNCFAISLAALPPPIHHGENANLKLCTLKEPHLRKNEIVELCEAFHCERCFPELHSPQSLMQKITTRRLALWRRVAVLSRIR